MNNQNFNFKIQHRKSSLMLVAMILLLSIAPIFGAVETTFKDSPFQPIFDSSDGFYDNLSGFSSNRFSPLSLFSPQSVYVVNTTGDQNDQLPGDGFCNDGGGNCSLRAAIQEANATAGAQVIDFDIPGGCDQVISPNSPLPALTDSATIDGYSQIGSLTNTAATGAIANKMNGILINGAVNSTVSGNVVSGNLTDGIGITGAGATGNVVKGNIVGLDATRSNDLGNTRDGVSIYQVGGNTVGGTNASDGNWIGGNNNSGCKSPMRAAKTIRCGAISSVSVLTVRHADR